MRSPQRRTWTENGPQKNIRDDLANGKPPELSRGVMVKSITQIQEIESRLDHLPRFATCALRPFGVIHANHLILFVA